MNSLSSRTYHFSPRAAVTHPHRGTLVFRICSVGHRLVLRSRTLLLFHLTPNRRDHPLQLDRSQFRPPLLLDLLNAAFGFVLKPLLRRLCAVSRVMASFIAFVTSVIPDMMCFPLLLDMSRTLLIILAEVLRLSKTLTKPSTNPTVVTLPPTPTTSVVGGPR